MRTIQFLTILRRELAAQFLRWRGAWIYPLALGPLFVISMHALHDRSLCRLDEESAILAAIFQYFYLRVAVFFACAFVFSRLFRGEMADRTLHYSLLAPLRRELLVAAKFTGGLAAMSVVFGVAMASCFYVMFAHFPDGSAFLGEGRALAQLGAYLGVTALAVLGYGTIFLAVGLVFKNPILPTLLVLALETWSGILPATLQYMTVSYYLKALVPVEAPVEGISAIFTVVADPPAPWLSVAGLVVLAGAALVYASRRVRRLEIEYTTD
jgi:ABC-type transport system involved in multi-copper enzyme maturation permease subunit